jgi:hypothetical protein
VLDLLALLALVAFVGLAVLEAVRMGFVLVDAREQGRQQAENFSERGRCEWVD